MAAQVGVLPSAGKNLENSPTGNVRRSSDDDVDGRLPSGTADSSDDSSPRSSTSSTWEDSIQNLSRELQTICRGASGTTGRLLGGSTTGSFQFPGGSLPRRRQCQRSSDSTSSSLNQSGPLNVLCPPPAVNCSHSFGGSVHLARPGWRPLRVQHEETSDKLHQSLTKICQQNSSPTSSTSTLSPTHRHAMPAASGSDVGEVTSSPDVEETSKSRHLRMKESLKSGVRVRLDLNSIDCDPINIYVVVTTSNTGDRSLHVRNAADANGSNSALLTVPVPAQSSVPSLACCITEGTTLYVRERSKVAACVDFQPEGSDVYLPVVRDDDSKLTVTVKLHVPDEFQFEDLCVKTVDDKLLVKGRRPSRAASFVVALDLPEGTYSRTVKAALAVRERQLVITAQCSPSSRRMTCNF